MVFDSASSSSSTSSSRAQMFLPSQTGEDQFYPFNAPSYTSMSMTMPSQARDINNYHTPSDGRTIDRPYMVQSGNSYDRHIAEIPRASPLWMTEGSLEDIGMLPTELQAMSDIDVPSPASFPYFPVPPVTVHCGFHIQEYSPEPPIVLTAGDTSDTASLYHRNSTPPLNSFRQQVGSEQITYAGNRRRRNDANFVCPICDQRFTCKRNQDNHMSYHAGTRNWICRYQPLGCLKSYMTKGDNKRHERTCPRKPRDEEQAQLEVLGCAPTYNR